MERKRGGGVGRERDVEVEGRREGQKEEGIVMYYLSHR